MIKGITPTELKVRLDSGEAVFVVDVRQDWELDISKVDFATQIVLHDLPARANEIPMDKPVVFICRSGGRSLQAAEFFAANGWPEDHLFNLDGGILRWAREIDPTLPTFY
jgi:adenylyltransferase/sulfurtransferase